MKIPGISQKMFRKTKNLYKKVCKKCGNKFTPMSYWQEYCSDCHKKKENEM